MQFGAATNTRMPRGRTTNNDKSTVMPARQKGYVRAFFFPFFLVHIWVFRGKGVPKTRGNKLIK
jgi:hypothetical protein